MCACVRVCMCVKGGREEMDICKHFVSLGIPQPKTPTVDYSFRYSKSNTNALVCFPISTLIQLTYL